MLRGEHDLDGRLRQSSALRRSLGSRANLRFDPFLMLDELYSDDPDDYLAGFSSHPHRGFETVTYMLDGRMRHEDSQGNRGDLGLGDVPAAEIPVVSLPGGGEVRVIAGRFADGTHAVPGPLQGSAATAPIYLDLRLPQGASVTPEIAASHQAFIYV